MMIRKAYIYSFLVFFLFLVFSCSKTETQREKGRISISLVEDNTVKEVLSYGDIDVDAAVPVSKLSFSVSIYNTEGKLVDNYNNYSDMPSSIELPTGTYIIKAVSNGGEAEAQFGQTAYAGEKQVEIHAGDNGTITIDCYISYTKVTVTYSDGIKSLLKSYKTVVTNENGGELEFVGDDSREGFIKPTSVIAYTLSVETQQGDSFFITREKEGLKAADHLHIHFREVQTGEGDPTNAAFEILVDETVNRVEHNFKVQLEKSEPPVITGDNVNTGEPVNVKYGISTPVTINVESTSGLGHLYISNPSGYFESVGLPQTIDLLNISDSYKNVYETLGITHMAVSGANNAVIDLTAFTAKLTAASHEFIIIAADREKQEVSANILFEVYSKPVFTLEAQATGDYNTVKEGDVYQDYNIVMLNGQWQVQEKPEKISFKYKEKSAEEWIVLAPENMVVDMDKRAYSAKVKMKVETEYDVQAIVIEGEEADNQVSVTAQSLPYLPNLNFDTWTQSGKTWYPNGDSSNSFWATGNEGVNMFPVSKDSNTAPTDDAVSGKAAEMVSYDGIMVVGFAAGNLFTGTYSTNISDPASSVNFGRPFTGRPRQLIGYYKYSPTVINTQKDGNSFIGQMDKCHIYIQLERRVNGNTEVIGYGELYNDNEVTSYTPFTIDINYTSEEYPTHVTLVATSSKEGGNFCGGAGSKLWVDEFRLIY